MNERKKKPRKKRLPWKRGPVAGKIVAERTEILESIRGHRRRFISLRQAAKLLGVSTQPVQDWIRLGYLKREGQRKLISREELERFVVWLVAHDGDEGFEPSELIHRIHGESRYGPRRFAKLEKAKISWHPSIKALTPPELARLVGCHPSLIRKAITEGHLGAKPKAVKRKRSGWYSPQGGYVHFQITRRAWDNAFPGTILVKERLPNIPMVEMFRLNDVSWQLRSWGIEDHSPSEIRKLIHANKLEAIRPCAGQRNYFVTRKELVILRKKLLKGEKPKKSLHDL